MPVNEEPHKHDETIKIDDLNIQVCHRSLMYLIGTEIVWEESPVGGGLTFINPNAGEMWVWRNIYPRQLIIMLTISVFEITGS